MANSDEHKPADSNVQQSHRDSNAKVDEQSTSWNEHWTTRAWDWVKENAKVIAINGADSALFDLQQRTFMEQQMQLQTSEALLLQLGFSSKTKDAATSGTHKPPSQHGEARAHEAPAHKHELNDKH